MSSVLAWCRELVIGNEANEQHKDLFLLICDTSAQPFKTQWSLHVSTPQHSIILLYDKWAHIVSDVQVTVHLISSYNKINQMHKFLKFILGIKLYMFRTVPLFIIRSFSLYTQTCMTYTIAVCTVKNSL